ncbi:MAG: ATP-binding protein [Gammaproteobacteria bacterium]|nr:ATP-binding protein [Gammaproteobacteria bacterium]
MSVFDRIRKQVGEQKNFDVEKAIADVKRWRQEDEAKQPEHYKKQFDEARVNETVGRSGILPMHQNCSVDNYIVNSNEQGKAKAFAEWYINNFSDNSGGGFIFSGTPGTGKNHLAAAICNSLMARNHSCLVITVTELMQKLRNCYQSNSETTEDKFIQSMIDFDLLILDEIGLQRGTDAERLALNQIVDQRISRFKPTGMLTNLPAGSNDGSPSMSSVLGVRIMDRMRSCGGQWISFNWESYRK